MAESLRFLILEDNPADTELLQFELHEGGLAFTSKVVTTEKEYVQAIQDYCPDIILSDYDLPKYNGALALAEANRRCPDTPFILVTGAVSEDRAIEILTQGAKDYVLKNRLDQRLVPAVKRALAEAEEHRARKQAEDELREVNRTLEERVKNRTAELEAEIAERKKIADSLQMSERRERERAEELATILDAVPTPVILVHDPDSTHMTGNRSADELLRQQPGKEVSLSAPPEIKPQHFKAFKGGRELKIDELPAQRAARGEHVKDFEFSLVFSDGEKHDLLGYGTPLLDQQQRPRGAVHVLVDITERKRAEDGLKLDAAILETVAEGIFLIGLDDNIIKWTNRKFEQLFGYGPGEMVGMHVDEVNAPTERTPAETRISIVDVLRQTGEWHGEIESIRKDGTRFWCHIHVSLFNHPEFGTVMVSAHTDITEHKQTEKSLKESEERFRSMSNASLEGLMIHDQGVILDANLAFAQLFGYEHPEELIGKKGADFLLTLESRERINLRMQQQESGPIEVTGIRKDGATFEAETESQSIKFRGHQARIVSCRNITERKRAENSFRESEERFRAIFEGSTDGMLIADTQTKAFVMGNPSICRMLGYRSEEIPTMQLADIHRREDLPVVLDLFERLTTGRERIGADIPMKRKDGSVFLADVTAYLITLPGKTYVVGSFRDITERKQVKEQLQQKVGELMKANAELTRLNKPMVGHELRVVELKKEIDKLCRQFGEPTRYGYETD